MSTKVVRNRKSCSDENKFFKSVERQSQKNNIFKKALLL